MPQNRLLGAAALLTAHLLQVTTATGEPASFDLPREWTSAAAGAPAVSAPWSLCQVWPDRETEWSSYHPLTWRGEYWGATNGNHGADYPSATVTADALTLRVRGAWGGNPGRKGCALVFTAQETGIYRFQGELESTRTGGTAALLRTISFDAQPPHKGEPRFTVQFRLIRAPRPTPLDRELFLEAGARLAFYPTLADNNGGEVTLRGLRAAFVSASAAPADFIDGLKPAALPPLATDETPPKIVVEGEQRTFPADAGVTDVTQPPYNAKGDGLHDDTAAIQRALNEGRIVYLPNGVYLVSDQLRFKRRAKVPSRTMLIGQSVKGAIIKLRDRTMDFGEPKEPCAVIWTSHSPPQAFLIYVRNLTIDTGRGNPGAIGCQFYANNIGAIMDVTIRSGDGSGAIGLDLGFSDDQGPMLARNIRVEGFDIGLSTARQTTVTTLEHIAVEGQRVCGWRNDLHAIAVRDFTSRNDCPALVSSDPGGHVALTDAVLTGTGAAAAAVAAIDNAGGMFLRNVTTTGYAAAIVDRVGRALVPETTVGPSVDEWTSHPVLTLFPDSPKRSLRLPVMDPPVVPWGALDTWASVKAFGPEVRETGEVSKGKRVTYEDWSGAFSNALSSGRSTVYFPVGDYRATGTFVVPPTVTRLIGMESTFGRGLPPTVLEVGDGTEPLLIADWEWQYSTVVIRHTGKRTLVIQNVSGSQYRPEPGAGDVFIDDNCQGSMVFVKGQRAWLRQCDPEYGTLPHITNNGADLWILGLKTEGYSTIIATHNGGRTEVIGGSIYANQNRDAEPAFIVTDGSALSVSVSEWILRSCNFFEWVVEQRGDELRVLRDVDVPKRGYDPDAKPIGGYGTSAMIPLFTGYRPAQAGEGEVRK